MRNFLQTRKAQIAAGVFSTALLVSIVVFLRAYHPEAQGFDKKGLHLLLYHGGRLALIPYLLVVCFTVGFYAIERLGLRPRQLFANGAGLFIACFFFGASLYGLIFSAIGLAGLLSLASALMLAIPAIFFAGGPVRALVSGNPLRTMLESDKPYAGALLVRLLAIAVLLIGTLFLAAGVLYLAVYDPNIWEHYLHYYRSVLASGSTRPSEVWHHFYGSKGAGLILLTNILSDYFGMQIVSACFILVGGVLILDLLRQYARSTTWALCGLILFLAYAYGNATSGEMFKHHGVILGYASFVLWACTRLVNAYEEEIRRLVVVFAVPFFYFGFYQPVAAALFPLALLLIVLLTKVFGDKPRWLTFGVLAAAICVGTAVDMAINWSMTGLPEVTPMRLVWRIADQGKAADVFGLGGIEFFLATNNNLSPKYDWSFMRMAKVLRYPLWPELLPAALLGALVLLLQAKDRKLVAEPERFLLYLVAFLAPLSAFAQAVQTAAVDRMALYSIVLTTLAAVIVTKRLVELCVDKRLWHTATVVLVLVGTTLAFVRASGNLEGKTNIRRFANGSISLKASFLATEASNHSTTGIKVDAMQRFRESIGAGERILRLSYDAGFSYSLPGNGIVSEPTYALVRDPHALLRAEPQEVLRELDQHGIRYFTLHLRSLLFTTYAFTKLFEPAAMQKYFSLAYEDGDFFILKRRTAVAEPPLPAHLTAALEFKRTGVLHYPFSDQFADRVVYGPAEVRDIVEYRGTRDRFRKDVSDAFEATIGSNLTGRESKAWVRAVLAEALTVSELSADLEAVLVLRRASTESSRTGGRVTERQVRRRLLERFRSALHREYVSAFGEELAAIGRNCDERAPFGMNREVRACF